MNLIFRLLAVVAAAILSALRGRRDGRSPGAQKRTAGQRGGKAVRHDGGPKTTDRKRPAPLPPPPCRNGPEGKVGKRSCADEARDRSRMQAYLPTFDGSSRLSEPSMLMETPRVLTAPSSAFF